ncbi:uncharacterized protein DMENIID0001_057310 [Sergentomyia squamirostris]
MSGSRSNSGFRPKSRESRWDRIKRKNTVSTLNIKTETVRKFLNVFTDDFLANMVRKSEEKQILDPAVVMDARHEAIKKVRKGSGNSAKPEFREQQMEKIVNHNKTIEINLIENELAKFRKEITAKRTPVTKVKITENPFRLLDNTEIFSSLSTTEERTNDFYKKIIEAPLVSSEILQKNENYMKKGVSESDQDDEEDLDKNQKTSCVQFEENVKVITYPKETSVATEAETKSEFTDNESLTDEEAFLSLNFRKDRQMIYCEETTTTTKAYFSFHGITSSPSQYSDSGSSSQESTASSTIFNHEDDIELDFLADAIKNIASEKSQARVEPVTELTVKKLLPTKRMEEAVEKEKEPINPEVSPEKLKIISELFREHSETYKEFKEILLRKYFLKWIHYTTVEKVSKCQGISTKNDRIGKIDAFLNKIREEKRRGGKKTSNPENPDVQKPPAKEESIILAKKYRTKLKIQQDIIEYQKLKLERQERMITELRLSKLSEEARNFKMDLKNELKQVAKTGDIRVRTKAKCLQIVSNLRDEEDENKLTAYGSVIPRFLAQMQERALERNLRHDRVKERRRQLEREREEEKYAQEEEKRREDEEAKKARIEALREKRRREKQEKLRREQERQTWIMNCRRANDFYRTHLLKIYGIGAFRKLLLRKKRFETKAVSFRKVYRMRVCFRKWKAYTKSIWDKKHKKAEEFHGVFVLRQSMRLWKESHLLEKGKLLVAVDWYEMRLNERFFSFWLARSKQEKIVLETKFKHAEAHYCWHLKWRSIEHWQRLHAILKLEKETEARRQRWRHKIWELLPDYSPNVDI